MGKRQRINDVYIVIVIVLIILLFGWFWNSETSEKKQSENTDGKQPNIEHEKLKKEIQSLEEKIEYCHENEVELLSKKSKFFLFARIVVGIIIIGFNFCYYLIYKKYNIDDFLAVNQILLFVYSFFAFITYGTLENFSSNIKSKVVYFLHQNNFYFQIDLENLVLRRESVLKKITMLENNLKEIKSTNYQRELDS